MSEIAFASPPPPYSWVHSGYFDRRREYRTRRGRNTRDWLLFFTLSGTGLFRYDGGEFIAKRGDIAFYTPGTSQDYGLVDSRQRWEFLWFHFYARPDWAEIMRWPPVNPGLLHLKVSERAAWTRLRDELRSAHHFASTTRRHAKVRAMHALETFFLECTAQIPEAASSVLDPRIERCLEFIQRNLRTPISRTVLAEHVGLSLHRFSHLFQEQVGKSPRQFVEEERIKIARHLIESTSTTFSEIAEETGFPNLFYFSQRFKASTGLSPSAFRAELRKEAGSSAR